MSKPRYNWWPFALAIIRDYPARKAELKALQEQKITADISGMPRSGGTSRAPENLATRQLPPQEQREYDAVHAAINRTKTLPDAKLRLEMRYELQRLHVDTGSTFEILEGSYVAEAKDLTAYLGTEELINFQNQKALFTGLTVEKIEYKNGEPGDDIYLTFGLNGASYDFCVERYLTDPETEVYKTVATLNVGDVVNVEGFVYWYNGINTHITNITK